MEEIIIKDTKQKDRFFGLYNENKKNISNDLNLLIKNVIIILKRHSNNEELIILSLIYLCLFFGIINKNNKYISKNDLKNINIIEKSFKHEITGEYKDFLDDILKMNKELFLVKIIIKYNILSFEKKFINIINNPLNYYKSIGYIIPYLTYLESPLLGFFQDIYFKKIYPNKFEKTRKYYIDKINKIEFPGEHMFFIVNNVYDLMGTAGVIGKTQVRRKTYFSIYNKLVRKKGLGVLDTIGIRVIFTNLTDLNKFYKLFESKYVFLNKKDYITNPKENGYQSLHYKYISPYRDTQILVELQLRTLEMDKEIKENNSLSHFEYTVKQNKWSKLFKEVNAGYNYIIKNNDLIKKSETFKN